MERIRIPGSRDVRGVIDGSGADRIVVGCPPHPQMGGSRSDQRLQAVGDALAERGVACLRFDYGPWDEGRGERDDARAALAWATDRYDRAALFGYSFGGGVALLTAAETPVAVAALSPVATLDDGSDVVAATARIDAPLWVGYGTRDDTVDAAAVADAVGERGTVATVAADHFFVGQERTVGERVAAFFAEVV